MEGSNNSNSILGLLQHGCDLAKKMEVELPSLWVTPASTSNPLIITQKCDEIIECFSMVKEHLTSMHPSLVDQHHLLHLHQHHPYQPEMMAATAYERREGKSKEVAEGSMKAAESDRHEMERGRTMEVGGSSSLAQQRNPKRVSRNDDQGDNRRRVRMAAPQIGNTEVPPEDGFTWRKYGQKEILNARYPRSYYRCTHQKLYNCPAKKQVQRLDDDPNTFDVLYRGDHTCHMSNTAPSVPPPPPPLSQAVDDDVFTTHLPPITTVHQWLSMDLTKPSSEGACTLFDPQQQQQQLLYRASSSSSILGVNNHPDAGTSTVGSHQGRDHQTVDLLNNPTLLDWTEMFNSGSSGSNSMEIIFPSNDDNNNNKWDNKDIKD